MKIKELKSVVYCKVGICLVISEKPFAYETLFNGYLSETPKEFLDRDIQIITGAVDYKCCDIQIFVY